MTPYFNLYRGYLHIVLSSSFEHPLPLWLSSGTAELFGNLRVREKDVFLGRMIPWHIERLREMQLLPLEMLLGADRASPQFREGDRRRLFDAQSWAFLHYLLYADEGRHAAQLNRFVALLAQGRKEDVSRREAFPDLAGLEKGLGSYVRSVGIRFSRIDVDVDIERQRLPSRAVPPAESAAVRAAFHVAMNRPNEARALIQEAKAADPAAADLARAAALYKKSCDGGDKSGCAGFAWLQARGEGIPRDEARAMATLDGLCAEDFFQACTQLAVLHAGRRPKPDLIRAKELLQKACTGGDSEACGVLASMPR